MQRRFQRIIVAGLMVVQTWGVVSAQDVSIVEWHQAEDVSSVSSGIIVYQPEAVPRSGSQVACNALGDCGDGEWARYDSIDFLDGQFDSVMVGVFAGNYWDPFGSVEVRLDNLTGQLLAVISLSRSTPLSGAELSAKPTGIHPVYFVFRNQSPVGNFDKFAFAGRVAIDPSDARDYYVDGDGDDGNNGLSPSAPFRTIGKAASVMKPGSNCYIRQGIYRETVTPRYGGLPGAPLTFRAYNNEMVYISGCDSVKGWVNAGVSGRPSIYRAPMNWSLGKYRNQVLVNGEMAYMARSPNIDEYYNYPPGDVIAEYYYGGQRQWREFKGQVHPALIPAMINFSDNNTPGGWVASPSWSYDMLADNLGRDLPAALLNKPANFLVGALLTQHNDWWGNIGVIAGSSNQSNSKILLQVDATSGTRGGYNGLGYISHLFDLLDAPNEWFFRNDTLYLWAPGGANPSALLVEAKRRTLGFDLAGKQCVTLQGLRFIGTSASLADARDCIIDDCHFKFVSHFDTFTWYETGANFWSTPLNPVDGNKGVFVSGERNTIQNSTIQVSCGSGIIVEGNHHVIRNNRIHDIDYAHTYDAGIFVMKRVVTDDNETVDLTIEHNTIYTCGRSCINIDKAGNTEKNGIIRISYNDFGRSGFLSYESGSIYMFTSVAMGSEIDHNWFHDNGGFGTGYISFDGGNMRWKVHHNVFWQGTPISGGVYGWTGMPEPSNPYMGPSGCYWFNNTIVDSNCVVHRGWDTMVVNIYKDGMGTYQMRYSSDPYYQSGNDTLWRQHYRNNLYCYSDTTPWKFTDPVRRDYTLRAGSPAIGRGQEVPGYVAAGGDWGAYQHDEPRWGAGSTTGDVVWTYPPPPVSSTGIGIALGRAPVVGSVRLSRNDIAVAGPPGASVRLYDGSGRLAGDMTMGRSGLARFRTSGMASGLYFVQVHYGVRHAVWKVPLRK